MTETEDLFQQVDKLNSIGIALSSERNTQRLLEMILIGAQELVHADGGTLYLAKNNELSFEIIRNKSLAISMGGSSDGPITFKPVPMYQSDGQANEKNVVTYSALHKKTINIKDAYNEEGFDFSGTKAFDAKTGYRSHSMLTVPMKDHHNEIIGVLQLINCLDANEKVVPFSEQNQRLVESLASQAAVALTKKNLVKELEDLLDSFIMLVATAIDEKSPYTGGHCRRIPELTLMLAKAASEEKDGPLSGFKMDEDDIRELTVASWLHDCGKITTPEYVIDKATKLETIFDRIHLINTRFELLKTQVELDTYKKIFEAQKQNQNDEIEKLQKELEQKLKQLNSDKTFINEVNIGSEFMDENKQVRVLQIAKYTLKNEKGEEIPFLSDNEVYNLNIPKGTLTKEEREIINNHIKVTIRMLESLPFPKHLKRVPEFAGGHHEKMDGKGYPKGLKRDEMSIQARCMGIADIFEALTAKDRPYKKPKPLSEALSILGKMKLDNHVDPDLFDIFIKKRIYLDYAKKFLPPEQIDFVDHKKIPGYSGEI